VRATQGAGGWLVLPGDLPLIEPQALQRVAAALARADVVLPSHGGTRGHPVGFSVACRDELLALSGEAGAAAIVQARKRAGQVLELALEGPGCVTDIDTLGDLARAERLLLSPPA